MDHKSDGTEPDAQEAHDVVGTGGATQEESASVDDTGLRGLRGPTVADGSNAEKHSSSTRDGDNENYEDHEQGSFNGSGAESRRSDSLKTHSPRGQAPQPQEDYELYGHNAFYGHPNIEYVDTPETPAVSRESRPYHRSSVPEQSHGWRTSSVSSGDWDSDSRFIRQTSYDSDSDSDSSSSGGGGGKGAYAGKNTVRFTSRRSSHPHNAPVYIQPRREQYEDYYPRYSIERPRPFVYDSPLPPPPVSRYGSIDPAAYSSRGNQERERWEREADDASLDRRIRERRPTRYRSVDRSRNREPSRSWSRTRSRSRMRRRNRSRSRSSISPEPRLTIPRLYRPAVSVDPDDNAANLAQSVKFRQRGDPVTEQASGLQHGPSMLRAWHEKHSRFTNGAETELVLINAAESFTTEGGKSAVTLYCQKDALGKVAAPQQRQIYWLHVQHTSDVINSVKNLISCCPLIEKGYRALALSLLDVVLPQNGDTLRRAKHGQARTIVARYDGESEDDPLDRKTVTFISTPYFAFRERQPGQPNSDSMQTLLSSQHGFDLPGHRTGVQVLSETQKWLGREIMHVARMRSLLIGPEVLLTWGELPLSALCKDNIIIDDSDSRPLVTVRITDFYHKEYYSHVKHDVSFAELNAQIMSLTDTKEFEIWQDRPGVSSKVTPELWVKLLGDASTNLADIHLRLVYRHPLFLSEESAEPYREGSRKGSYSMELVRYRRHRSRSWSRRRSTYRTSSPWRHGVPQSRSRTRIRRRSGSPWTDPQRTRSFTSTRSLNSRTGALQLYHAPPTFLREQLTSSPAPASPYGSPDRNDAIVPMGSRSRLHSDSWSRAVARYRDNLHSSPAKPWMHKVVNDLSVTRRGSRTYQLSSSESDSETLKTSMRQSYATQAQSSSHFESPKRQSKDSEPSRPRSEKERTMRDSSSNNVEEGQEWTQRGRRGTSAQPWTDRIKTAEGVLNNEASHTTPFLRWRVTKGDGESNGDEGNYGTMIRLIRQIHTSLAKNKQYCKVYAATYQCSMESLCSRHEALTGEAQHWKSSQDSIDSRSSRSSLTKAAGVPRDGRQRPPDAQDHGQAAAFDQRAHLYVNTVEQANTAIGDLFAQSKSILGHFMPLQEIAGQAHMKEILDRYWGALDMMFRHLQHAARTYHSDGKQLWRIRGSCQRAGKSGGVGCQACSDNTEYSLVGALEHLHASGAMSRSHAVPERPHEDPCIVWLQHIDNPQTHRQFSDLLVNLQDFNQDLRQISELSRELHLSVARPGGRAEIRARVSAGEGERRDSRGTAKDSSAQHGENRDGRHAAKNETQTGHVPNGHAEPRSRAPSETPALPGSLLDSFEYILTLFTVQARVVVLRMRESDRRKTWARRAFKAEKEYTLLFSRVTAYLERAKQDLILSIVAKDQKSVRLGAVGPEYITGMLISNVQTGVFRFGAGSSRVTERMAGVGGELRRGTRRSLVTWTDDFDQREAAAQRSAAQPAAAGKGPQAATSLDFLALYTEHARALEFSASVNPQRRAFLAIRALEDELRAIKSICALQLHCLDNTIRTIDPLSFRVTDRERQVRFPLELKVLLGSKRDRQREAEDLAAMLEWMGDLRQRVIESIEVLDEGHGKAIRVFTLVTLFFLPLSFVTGFFGMNTADVRDMTLSSSLYWAVAVPITLSVLGLAYLYGYKWEALKRRVTGRSWLEQGVAYANGEAGSARRGLMHNTMARFRPRRTDSRNNTMDSYSWRGTKRLDKYLQAEP